MIVDKCGRQLYTKREDSNTIISPMNRKDSPDSTKGELEPQEPVQRRSRPVVMYGLSSPLAPQPDQEPDNGSPAPQPAPKSADDESIDCDLDDLDPVPVSSRGTSDYHSPHPSSNGAIPSIVTRPAGPLPAGTSAWPTTPSRPAIRPIPSAPEPRRYNPMASTRQSPGATAPTRPSTPPPESSKGRTSVMPASTRGATVAIPSSPAPAQFKSFTEAFPSYREVRIEDREISDAPTPLVVQVPNIGPGADDGADVTIERKPNQRASEVDPSWQDTRLSEIAMPLVATRYHLALLAQQVPELQAKLFKTIINGYVASYGRKISEISGHLPETIKRIMARSFKDIMQRLKQAMEEGPKKTIDPQPLIIGAADSFRSFSRDFTSSLISELRGINLAEQPLDITDLIAAQTHFRLGQICRDTSHRQGEKKLFPEEVKNLFLILEKRFHTANYAWRHPPGLTWDYIIQRLQTISDDKLWALFQMEATGGMVDVVGVNDRGELVWRDCSPYSPSGRRNLVYDQSEEDQFYASSFSKTDFINGNAFGVAREIGSRILSSQDHLRMQNAAEKNSTGLDYRYCLTNSADWVIPSVLPTGHTLSPSQRASNQNTESKGRLALCSDLSVFRDMTSIVHSPVIGFRSELTT